MFLRVQKIANIYNFNSSIGPAKAKELVDSGISSIEDLRMNQETLTKGQIIGLKHFEDFELRIPREEIALAEKLIRDELKKIDPLYKITICGSHRFVNCNDKKTTDTYRYCEY